MSSNESIVCMLVANSGRETLSLIFDRLVPSLGREEAFPELPLQIEFVSQSFAPDLKGELELKDDARFQIGPLTMERQSLFQLISSLSNWLDDRTVFSIPLSIGEGRSVCLRLEPHDKRSLSIEKPLVQVTYRSGFKNLQVSYAVDETCIRNFLNDLIDIGAIEPA